MNLYIPYTVFLARDVCLKTPGGRHLAVYRKTGCLPGRVNCFPSRYGLWSLISGLCHEDTLGSWETSWCLHPKLTVAVVKLLV